MQRDQVFAASLCVPLLPDEGLFLDRVLEYVKRGIGCSQINGRFYYRGQVENLDICIQTQLAQRIQQWIGEEKSSSLLKNIASFFIDMPSGYVERAHEILSYCAPNIYAEAKKWLPNIKSPTTEAAGVLRPES